MILSVFLFLLGLSLVLIFLGFYRQEHSELLLAGFLFMFLLSFVILGNALVYKVGVVRSGNFTYNSSAATPYLMNASVSERDSYADFTDETGNLTTHRLGWVMLLISAVGFIGTIMGIPKMKWGRD